MTHEYLTPGDMSRYSINRMPDSPDSSVGGAPRATHNFNRAESPMPNSNARGVRSPQSVEAVREYWGKQLESLDPNEREMRKAIEGLRDRGIPPISGGADIADFSGYTETHMRRVAEETANEIRRQAAVAGGGTSALVDRDYSQGQIDRVRRLIDENPGNTTLVAEGTRLIEQLEIVKAEKRIDENREREEARREQEADRARQNNERFGLYLQPEDIHRIEVSPEEWLNSKFDIIYRSAAEGQELSSPVVQGIQTVIGEAVRWLEYNKPDQLDHFQQLQTIRFNLMYMRTQIGLGDIDKIRGTAAQLGVHGLMYGMAMEDGKVGQMFGRMHELLEDERLKGNDEHHVTPEMVNKLQTAVINEQIELAEKGLSSFGDLSEGKARLDSAISEYKRNNPGATSEQVKAGCEAEYEEYGKIREPLVNTLTRTVRAAYDVFVSSQRQGVLVARGKRLTGGEAYFSDPSSGPLNVYNLEDLAIKKFDMYNAHDQEFIAKIKINMAEGSIKDRRKAAGKMTSEAKAAGRNLTPEEQRQVADANRDLTEHEKEELGTRLFRDIFAMPDFFSSGWRIAGYLNSIDQRCIAHFEGQGDDEVTARRKGLELSKDFALFMRLRAPEARKDMTGKEQDDKKKEPILERIAEIRPEEIVRLFRERIQNDHSPATESMRTRLASLYAGLSRIDGDVTNYDSFKKKYGAIIQNLRQKGFKEMRQLRIGQNLTNQERTTVNTWFEDGNASNKLQEMMRLMTDFSRASVTELATHDKFEDIYTRTILTDDALLDQLENSTQKDATGKTIEDRDGKPIEFTPISKMLSADQKGDPMIRIWNDTAQAINAGKSLIDFIKKESPDEKFKAALEFGEATSQYNGQSSRAKTLRWTWGTYLELAKTDMFWDIMGAEKGPFRKSISEIERIYGPAAHPLGREELRIQLDKIHIYLVADLNKRYDEMTDEEREAEHERVETMYVEMEKALEVTTKDVVKRRSILILLSVFFGVVAESMDFAKKGAA